MITRRLFNSLVVATPFVPLPAAKDVELPARGNNGNAVILPLATPHAITIESEYCDLPRWCTAMCKHNDRGLDRVKETAAKYPDAFGYVYLNSITQDQYLKFEGFARRNMSSAPASLTVSILYRFNTWRINSRGTIVEISDNKGSRLD